MAFPQVASITETIFNSDTTAHAVAMPAAVDAGDLLLCIFCNDADDTVTTPSGWTVQWAGAGVGAQMRMQGYVKDADGSEGGTTVDFVTSGVESAVAQVYRITGWAGSLPGDVEDGTPASGTTNAPNPPSLNPSWGTASDTLFIAVEMAQREVAPDGYPADYTNGESTVGIEHHVASARRELNIGSAEDPGTFDLDGVSNRNWVAQTIAIKGTAPVAAAPFSLPELGVQATLMRY